MLKIPPDPVPRQVWTPQGRTSRQLRNSRAKVIGSVAILVFLLAVLIATLAGA